MNKLSEEAKEELFFWNLELFGIAEGENFDHVTDRGNIYHVKDRMRNVFYGDDTPLEIVGVELALSLYRNELIQKDQYATLLRVATGIISSNDAAFFLEDAYFKHTGKDFSDDPDQEEFEALPWSSTELEIYNANVTI